MAKIAIKLAELSQRVVELEAQISLHGRQAAFLEGHGRPQNKTADESVAAMQKRLSSLKRSCQILARHSYQGPSRAHVHSILSAEMVAAS